MAATLTQVGPKDIGHVFDVHDNNRQIIKTWSHAINNVVDFIKNNVLVNLFRVNDKIFSLPVVKGTEGEIAIDTSKLRDKSTGYAVTMDTMGLGNTAYPSAVTFIDGEKAGEGILNYRGYNIKDLAQKASFPEVAYLLFNDKLPNAEELAKFESDIKAGMKLEQEIIEMVRKLPSSVHPMNILSAAIAALEGFTAEVDRKDYAKNFPLIIGKVLALTALLNRKSKQGADADFLPHVMVTKDVVDNFMKMMFTGKVLEEGELYQLKKRVIDKLLILHADHEQNCSTFTGRVVSSGGAGPFASVSAAINALYGPLHGGANQAALEELEAIRKLPYETADEKVAFAVNALAQDEAEKDKAKESHGTYKAHIHHWKDLTGSNEVMGFGHRVYKTRDPRATVIEDTCRKLFEHPTLQNSFDPETRELLDIAKKLETQILERDYFKKRNLFPNVDFYSGIVYKALGISPEMFTPLFAAGRTPGWLTHMQEQVQNPKIIRPRRIYTGKTIADRVALPAEKQPGQALAA